MLLCHRLEKFPITFERLFIVRSVCTVMNCTTINVLSCLFTAYGPFNISMQKQNLPTYPYTIGIILILFCRIMAGHK